MSSSSPKASLHNSQPQSSLSYQLVQPTEAGSQDATNDSEPPPPPASQAQLDLIVQLGLYLELKQLIRKSGSKRSKATMNAAKEDKSTRTLNTKQYNGKKKQTQVTNEFALEKINKILLKRNLSYDESMFRLTGASDATHTLSQKQQKNKQNGKAEIRENQNENDQQSNEDYDIENRNGTADASFYEDEEEYFDVDGFEEDIQEERISTNENYYGDDGDEAAISINEKIENHVSVCNQLNSTIQLNSDDSTRQTRHNSHLQENHYHDYDSSALDSKSVKLSSEQARASQLQSILMRQQQLLNVNLIMEDEIDSSIASILSDAYKLKPLIPYHLYSFSDMDDQHLITDGISNISCSSHSIAFDGEPLVGREWLSKEIEKVSRRQILIYTLKKN
jgi:hypothetical protein